MVYRLLFSVVFLLLPGISIAESYSGAFVKGAVQDQNFGATNLPSEISSTLNIKKVSGGVEVSGFSDSILGTRNYRIPRQGKNSFSASGDLNVGGVPDGCNPTYSTSLTLLGAKAQMSFTEVFDCPTSNAFLQYTYSGEFRKQQSKKRKKKKKKKKKKSKKKKG